MRAVALAGLLLCACGGSTTPNFGQELTPIKNCYNHNVWANSSSPTLLVTPKVHLVFWGGYWRTNADGVKESDQLSADWTVMANDTKFYSPMFEYGVSSGSLSGVYFTNTNAMSGKITNDYLAVEFQSEIDNGALPAADSNSLYVILLPTGTQLQSNLDAGFTGSHGTVNSIATATIEFDTNVNVMNEKIAHEIYEACTDTVGDGYNGGPGETEVGDFCEGTTYKLDGFTIQTIWSESVCKCIPN